MFVEKICAEGFKSYANRTEITGFHPHFNAITGYNGSGKSNILDSICFVLGITNLAQVRATKLQDLIYKQGQASTTKASVTVTFNNEDKNRSPVGYESHDKICVTRIIELTKEGKYLINGKNAKKHAVSQLFHSVQLNVNNPHFLIMQGRITKVINMKPVEILSMIEEASGTKMYENNKNEALKQINKKDAKLTEINDLLDNEIGPALEKVRSERSSYIEYKKNEKEMEILNRQCLAKRFHDLQNSSAQYDGKLNILARTVEGLTKEQNTIANELENLKPKLEFIKKKEKQQMGGEYEDSEKLVNALSTEFIKKQTHVENFALNIKNEKNNLKNLEKNKREDGQSLVTKQQQLEACKRQYEEARAISDEMNKNSKDLENKLDSLRTGVVNDETDLSLADQLKEYKTSLQNASTEKQQVKLHLKDSKSMYAQKKGIVHEAEKALAETNRNIANYKQEIESYNSRMQNIGYDSKVEDKLIHETVKLEDYIEELQNKVDEKTTKLSSIQFNYTPPYKSFDTNSVKGMVVRLIKVNDASHCTALEVTAGRKLYNVIVDKQKTGQEILQKGKLKSRVTILPLDKIEGRTLSDDMIRRAQEVGGGSQNVTTALSLIGYDSELDNAMAYVFGGAFVCTNSDSAKRVTFDKSISRKSVTLEGDVYEPSGTLTGGASKSDSSVIRQLQSLNKYEQELLKSQHNYEKLSADLKSMKALGAEGRELQQTIDLKQHQLNLLEETLRSSPFHQQLQELESLKVQIQELTETEQTATLKEKEFSQRIKSIENELKNFKQSRESHLKSLEKEIKTSKANAKAASLKTKEVQNKGEEIEFEIEEIQKELLVIDGQIQSLIEKINALCEEEKGIVEDCRRKEEEYNNVNEDLLRLKAKLEKTSEEKANLDNALRDYQEQEIKVGTELKEAENEVIRASSTSEKFKTEMNELTNKYLWIQEEKDSFGVAGGTYDFNNRRFKDVKKQLEACEKKMKSLKANVNMKAISRFDEVESEHTALLKNKHKVEADRAKILKSIEELDEKKNQTLQETYVEVNGHFSSIFSTLLPGAKVELKPQNERNLLEGLEVKVGFGKEWKNSLTELSGGQRSLVALSLILALLRYKPAPMYILDEVDSALDLSHTQNIGKMLRMHFSNSQFIVVSLKEGMYNNANVLFQTAFVNGVSTVRRTLLKDQYESETNATNKNSGKRISKVGVQAKSDSSFMEEEQENITSSGKRGKGNRNSVQSRRPLTSRN